MDNKNYNIYISHFGDYQIDHVMITKFLESNSKVLITKSLEKCDIYLVLSGMYITYGYKQKVEIQLEQAKNMNKKIIVVAPHGTGYIPKFFKDQGLEYVLLNKSSIDNRFKKYNLNNQVEMSS